MFGTLVDRMAGVAQTTFQETCFPGKCKTRDVVGMFPVLFGQPLHGSDQRQASCSVQIRDIVAKPKVAACHQKVCQLGM
jgi:hypothetical protein